MKNNSICSILIAFALLLTACAKDNYKQPGGTLTGRVTYQGQPVGVRSNGVQLELWQRGYQVYSKIPVFVAQDGTFSASLFDGDYKLVQLKGNGPWVDKPDSIAVQVRGNAVVDLPVTPYFTIANEAFARSGTTVTASGKVTKISSNGIERVTLYIGTTNIVDATNNNLKQDLTGGALSDLSQALNFSLALPASLSSREYVYARLGVKTLGIGEMIYSASKKIDLK